MQLHPIKIESPVARSAALLGVALGYYLLGVLALQLATLNNNVSPVWPAAGLALGSILLFGNWVIPAIFIGSFLTNLTAGTTPPSSLIISSACTLAGVTAAVLIRKFNQRDYLHSYSEIISLLFSSFVSAVIPASIGTLVLKNSGIIGPESIFDFWYTWWSGDVTGVLLVTPLFLGLAQRRKAAASVRPKFLYGVLTFAIIALVIFAVFVIEINQAYIWILTPVFTFAGIMVSGLYARSLLIVISAYVIILTVFGYGPFEHGNMNRNLLYVQMLIASYSMGVLFAAPLNTKYKIKPRIIASLLLGWIVLFGAIYFASYFEKEQTQNDFRETVNSSIDNLHNMARQYEIFLEGQGTAISIWKILDDERWNRYVKATHVESLTDILNSIGFMKEMTPSEALDFSREQSVQIKTLEKDFADKNKTKFIVTHNQPFKTKSAKGWDLGSEPHRRKAAEDARRLKTLVITDPINLRRDDIKNDGLLIFHPVFRNNGEFLGWNYISALNNIFFGKAFNSYSYLINVNVTRENKNVYNNTRDNYELFRKYSNGPYYLKKQVTLFQKTFELEFHPKNLFFNRHTGYSAQLALLLNVFVLFITGFFVQQLTFGQRTEELVEMRTKELEISKIQLIHSSKMASLGEMASGMAHEINNPLTIIKGKIKVITLILEDLKIQDKFLNSELDKIKITTDRIGKIVKGLRTFSRVSENDPYDFIPLERLIHETMDLCSERFKSEGIDLVIQSIPDIKIKCRSGEISQVLINLLNNSSDAITNLDKKWIQISFSNLSTYRMNISVTDSGNGIPPHIADKIMDPFFTTKDVGKGTGLGLSISRGIIEAHGGELRLDQTSSHTRFIFDLEIHPS